MDKELPVSPWAEWKIIEKIGEGSYGKVYKAQRCERGKTFYSAIKIITIPSSKGELEGVRSETGNDQSTREYFQNLVEECIQEIATMEYFRGNSHVVSVEDFKVMEYLDEIGWDIFIRMEFLTSFMDYCEGKNLSEAEVIRMGIDLSKALEYCGKLNIIHRDIKPENIFVSRFGDFKLGDFGIARELERTMSNFSKKGTYSYMAPEMYRGEQYDSRVDICSLGILLYKLMNHNRLPFLNLEKQLITYRDKENALTRRMSGETMPNPVDAGEDFARIILKACAYDPEERYQTPEELHEELENLKYGRTTAGRHIEKKERRKMDSAVDQIIHPKKNVQTSAPIRQSAPARQKRRRRPFPWTVAVFAIALAVCLMIGLYFRLILIKERQKARELIQLLEENDYSTAQIDDFSIAIQNIKDHATTITNNLGIYKQIGKKDEIYRYYDEDGNLMKALIYPAKSDDGVYEEYFYWDEELFFAYIWSDEDDANLYYFNNGKMIRWIDEAGKVHDGETENPEYVERAEKYWENAVFRQSEQSEE